MPAFASTSTRTFTIFSAVTLGLSADDFADKPFIDLEFSLPSPMADATFTVEGGFGQGDANRGYTAFTLRGHLIVVGWESLGNGAGLLRFRDCDAVSTGGRARLSAGDVAEMTRDYVHCSDEGDTPDAWLNAVRANAPYPASSAVSLAVTCTFRVPGGATGPLGSSTVQLRESVEVSFSEAPTVVTIPGGDPMDPDHPVRGTAVSFKHFVNGQPVVTEIAV